MPTRLPWVLFTLSLLLNLFVLTGFVYRTWIAPPRFEHRMGPPQGGRSSLFSSLARDLDFDDKQRAVLKTLVDENASSRQQHFRDMQQLREDFVVEISRAQPDIARIDQLIDRTQALRTEMQKAFSHMLAQLVPHLRADQRERLQAILTERMSFGSRSPHPGSSRGGPGPGRPPQ